MGRKTMAVVFGLGSFVLFFFLAVGLATTNGKKRADMPVSEILTNLADAANDMVGDKAAANLVIHGASIEGNRLTYMYRIIGGTHIDESIADKKIRKIKRMVCRDRMMRRAVDGGAQISYSYRSVKGNEILAIDVDKSVCESFG